MAGINNTQAVNFNGTLHCNIATKNALMDALGAKKTNSILKTTKEAADQLSQGDHVTIMAQGNLCKVYYSGDETSSKLGLKDAEMPIKTREDLLNIPAFVQEKANKFMDRFNRIAESIKIES